MIAKTIRYEDYDGNPAEATYWFNLDGSEMVELDFTHHDDPGAYLKSVAQDKNYTELIRIWKGLLFKAVGVREGRRLVKTQEILDEFVQTGAYNALFMEVIQNEHAGFDFFKQLLASDLQKRVTEDDQKKDYTDEELLDMSDEEFAKAAGSANPKNWDTRFLQLGMSRKTNSRAVA